jgi:hypothetical protein
MGRNPSIFDKEIRMSYAQKDRSKKRQPETAPDQPPALLSCDIGNGYVKLRSATNLTGYMSVVGDVSETLDGFQGVNSEQDFIIGFEGKQIAIGETVYFKGMTAEVIRHPSRIETGFYRKLFASALAAGVPGNPKRPTEVEVVLSLPPAYYFDREKQKERLAGTYEVEVPDDGGRWVKVVYNVPYANMRVIPEGVGTVCMIALNDDGTERGDTKLHQKVVGVVDVGTLTTDLIKLDNLRIVRDGCTSEEVALNFIYKKLRTFAQHYGITIQEHRYQSVIDKGHFSVQGEPIPLDNEMSKWSTELAQMVDGYIRKMWAGGNDVDQIILTGGGARYVYTELCKIYRHVRLASDNALELFQGNADGGYRYGMLRRLAAQ